MPTMKTGAGSVFCARGPAAKRSLSKDGDIGVDKAGCASRENGWLVCARAYGPPANARRRASGLLPRPELGEIVMPHNRCSAPPPAPSFQRGFHLLGRRAAAAGSLRPAPAAPAASARAARDSGGIGPRAARASSSWLWLPSSGQLQQRQRLLQMPVARRARMTAGRAAPRRAAPAHRRRVRPAKSPPPG